MKSKSLITGIFIPLYIVSQLLTPDVAQAASLAFSANSETIASRTWSPSPSLGAIQTEIQSPNAKGTLIHIQDAHAVYEAQKNIQGLLEEMKASVHVDKVFLEGGADKLDPELKHLFKGGKKLSQSERDAWMQSGDLTGAEAFLMKHSDVEGHGIEAVKPYWENVEQYRRVHAQESASDEFLAAWIRQWQSATIRLFKPSLRKYLEVYARADKEAMATSDWFDALRNYMSEEWKRDMSSSLEQIDFPMFARYCYLRKIESNASFSAAEKEKKEFFEILKGSVPSEARGLTPMAPRSLPFVLGEIEALIQKFNNHEANLGNPREIFERLAEFLPQDFSMLRWPHLKKQFEQIILSGEISAAELQAEAKKLHFQIVKKDAAEPSAKSAVFMLERYLLLYKLLHLQLSRDEFYQIAKHSARPIQLSRDVATLHSASSEIEPKPFAQLEETYADAMQFYQSAIQRESIMEAVISDKLQKNKNKNIVLVTGGFHAKGMQEFAHKHQYNYVGVLPKISKITVEDTDHYHRALLGAVKISEVAEGRPRGLSRVSEVSAALMTSNEILNSVAASFRREGLLALRSEARRLKVESPGNAETSNRLLHHTLVRWRQNDPKMKADARKPAPEGNRFEKATDQSRARSEMRAQNKRGLLTLGFDAVDAIVNQGMSDDWDRLAAKNVFDHLKKTNKNELESRLIQAVVSGREIHTDILEKLPAYISRSGRIQIIRLVAERLQGSQFMDAPTTDATEQLKKLNAFLEATSNIPESISEPTIDLLKEYLSNDKKFHHVTANISAAEALSRFDSAGQSLLVELMLEFSSRYKNPDRRERLEVASQLQKLAGKHVHFFYSQLLEIVIQKRNGPMRGLAAAVLDKLAQSNPAFRLTASAVNKFYEDDLKIREVTRWGKIFDQKSPLWEGFLRWHAAVSDPAAFEQSLASLESLKQSLGSARFELLIKNWGLDRAARMQVTAKNFETANRTLDPLIWEVLSEEQSASLGLQEKYDSAFLDVGRKNSKLVDKFVFFVASAEGRLPISTEAILKLMAQNPDLPQKFLTLAVVLMRLNSPRGRAMGSLRDELTKTLNSSIDPSRFMVRKYLEAIPFGTGKSFLTARNLSKKLDDDRAHKGIFRLIRLSVHRQPDSYAREMLESFLFDIQEGKLNLALGFISPELRSRAVSETDYDEIRQLQNELRTFLAELKVENINHMLAMPVEKLEKHFSKKQTDPNVGESQRRDTLRSIVLLTKALRQCYPRVGDPEMLDVAGVLPDAAQHALAAGPSANFFKNVRLEIERLAQTPRGEVMEEDFERTYAGDHEFEDEMGFGLASQVVKKSEDPRLNAFEKTKQLRQIAFAQFSEYRSRLQKKLAVRRTFTQADLREVVDIYVELLRLLRLGNLGSRNLDQLADLLAGDNLSLHQIQDVLNQIMLQTQQMMDVFNLEFSGIISIAAEHLGRDGVDVAFRSQSEAHFSKAEQFYEYVEEKLLGDFLSEEGVMVTTQLSELLLTLTTSLRKSRSQTRLVPAKGSSIEMPKITFLGEGTERTHDASSNTLLVSAYGNKGATLVHLHNEGASVPPGFIFPTNEINALLRGGRNETNFRDQLRQALLKLEKLTHKEFFITEGSAVEPLLLAVRTGSFVPLPGVLDTALNFPYTQKVTKRMLERGFLRRIVLDDRRRYLESFASVILKASEKVLFRVIVKEKDRVNKTSIENFNDAEMDALVEEVVKKIGYLKTLLSRFTRIPSDHPDFVVQFASALRDIQVPENEIDAEAWFGLSAAEVKRIMERPTAADKPRIEAAMDHFRKAYARTYLDYDGDEFELLISAIKETAASWDSARGIRDRAQNDLSDDWRTPVIVQAQIFGNKGRDAGAFVLDTHNLVTGEFEPNGTFKRRGAGEDLVSGRTEHAIEISQRQGAESSLEVESQSLYQRIIAIAAIQAERGNGPRQLEGVVDENGKIWILQDIGLDLTYQGDQLNPRGSQKTITRGKGYSGGAKHVRFIFNHTGFGPLQEKINALRKQMNAKGEVDVGIVSLAQYIGPDEGVKFGLNHLDGMLTSAVGGGSHARVAATKRGKILISEVAGLNFDESHGGWRLNGAPIAEGLAGSIYSVDGNSMGATSGAVYKGRVVIVPPANAKKHKLANYVGMRKNTFLRSEARGLINIAKTDQGMMVEWTRTFSEFLKNPNRSETRLEQAMKDIRQWKAAHSAQILKEDPADPFQTQLEKEAKAVYFKHHLSELAIDERASFAHAVFEGVAEPVVQFMDGWLNSIGAQVRASSAPITPPFFQKISSKMANLEHQHNILHNQFIRTAGDLIFDLDPTQKTILELKGLVQELKKELGKEGAGNIPTVAAIQDIHGGTRRALALMAFAYGLPADSYKRIHNLKDLERELDAQGLSLDKFPNGRIVGFSDGVDRGPDPVGSVELIEKMLSVDSARFLLGNHDAYRALAALGIDKLFSGIDLYSVDNEGHHAGYWIKEAFHHAGWGDVELDQLNQRRFNYFAIAANQHLGHRGPTEKFALIDLEHERARLNQALSAAKKENTLKRQAWQTTIEAERVAAQAGARLPNPISKPDLLPLPDIFSETLKITRAKKAEYQKRIEVLRRTHPDLPGFESFSILDLTNYDQDREIVYSAIKQLKKFRLFYIDLYGNLHLHNLIPFDEQGRFSVKYREQEGLAALELMTRDIRRFFESLTDAEIESYISGNDSARGQFRKKIWNKTGEAFTEIISWYSDRLLHAKVDRVKAFAQKGNVGWLLGHTVGSFADRSPNGFIIMGHNERSKFPNKQASHITLWPEFGEGLLTVDGEMSPGYKHLGLIVTFGLRDVNGHVTGLKFWGFPEKKAGVDADVIQDLTLEELVTLRDKAHKKANQPEALPEGEDRAEWAKLEASITKQLPFFEKLTDGKTFLKWSLFKTVKELERQLNISLARQDLSAEKQTYLAQMLREVTTESARISNPLFESAEARSEMRALNRFTSEGKKIKITRGDEVFVFEPKTKGWTAEQAKVTLNKILAAQDGDKIIGVRKIKDGAVIDLSDGRNIFLSKKSGEVIKNLTATDISEVRWFLRGTSIFGMSNFANHIEARSAGDLKQGDLLVSKSKTSGSQVGELILRPWMGIVLGQDQNNLWHVLEMGNGSKAVQASIGIYTAEELRRKNFESYWFANTGQKKELISILRPWIQKLSFPRSEMRTTRKYLLPTESDLVPASPLARHRTRFDRVEELRDGEKKFSQFIELMVKKAERGPVRILSAGTSSGQEAYEIMMRFLDRGGKKENLTVVGIDSSDEQIEIARKGIYHEKLTGWGYVNATGPKDFGISTEYKTLVSFEVVDLLDQTQLQTLGKFDGIVSMNVEYMLTSAAKKKMMQSLRMLSKPDVRLMYFSGLGWVSPQIYSIDAEASYGFSEIDSAELEPTSKPGVLRLAASRSEARTADTLRILTAKIFAGAFLPIAMILVLRAKPAEAEQIFSQLVSVEETSQSRVHAQSILGLVAQSHDGIVLRANLALNHGFLAAIENIFSGTSFAIAAKGIEKIEIQKWIDEHHLSERVFVVENIAGARVKLKQHGALRVLGMKLAGEETLGISEAVSFTEGQLQRFYRFAGIWNEVQALVQSSQLFASAA